MEELRPLFATNFLYQAGFAFYTTFAAVYLLSHFGFTEGSIGNYFAFVGMWIVITQGFVTRKVALYFSEKKVVRFSLVATGVSIGLVLLAPNARYLYAIVPFFAMAVGLSQANITALISRSAGASIQGEVLGLNGSVMALAQTVPPLLSGVVAAYFAPAAPLFIATLLTAGAGLYFIAHIRKLHFAERSA
jgi:predicted MFS family arabinose efflux permease